jgi:hypothetical protein
MSAQQLGPVSHRLQERGLGFGVATLTLEYAAEARLPEAAGGVEPDRPSVRRSGLAIAALVIQHRPEPSVEYGLIRTERRGIPIGDGGFLPPPLAPQHLPQLYVDPA